jgi:hypothetical protein
VCVSIQGKLFLEQSFPVSFIMMPEKCRRNTQTQTRFFLTDESAFFQLYIVRTGTLSLLSGPLWDDVFGLPVRLIVIFGHINAEIRT